jgi:hypothetical protein
MRNHAEKTATDVHTRAGAPRSAAYAMAPGLRGRGACLQVRIGVAVRHLPDHGQAASEMSSHSERNSTIPPGTVSTRILDSVEASWYRESEQLCSPARTPPPPIQRRDAPRPRSRIVRADAPSSFSERSPNTAPMHLSCWPASDPQTYRATNLPTAPRPAHTPPFTERRQGVALPQPAQPRARRAPQRLTPAYS